MIPPLIFHSILILIVILIVILQVDSLSAAFPAIQVLAGDVEEAM